MQLNRDYFMTQLLQNRSTLCCSLKVDVFVQLKTYCKLYSTGKCLVTSWLSKVKKRKHVGIKQVSSGIIIQLCLECAKLCTHNCSVKAQSVRWYNSAKT